MVLSDSGLPAYHPDVIAQGFDPAVIDAAVNQTLVNLVKAGYNTKELFYGPEEVCIPVQFEDELLLILWLTLTPTVCTE